MTSAELHRAYDAHRRSVYAWAYRFVGNHHDALDVTQEVFIKWWRAHREHEPPRSPVAWLRRVTVNHSINLCRAKSNRSGRTLADQVHRGDGMEPPRSPDQPSTVIERREVAAAVAAAFAAVTEQQRAVLVAKIYDGCTFAAIAGQMDLAVPTVKTHYLRALRAVRRELIAAGLTPEVIS